MKPFRYSYFQLTFGQKEAYLHPEVTYQRLKSAVTMRSKSLRLKGATGWV
jgi:hypothetical protein